MRGDEGRGGVAGFGRVDGDPSPPPSPPSPSASVILLASYNIQRNNTIQYQQGRSVVDCWPHTTYNAKHHPVPTPPCFETTLVTKHRVYTIIKKERKKILIPILLYAIPS